MGFFKNFKDDFSQAASELMSGADDVESGITEDELVVNTFEGEMDVESELSKLNGLLEQVTRQDTVTPKQEVESSSAGQQEAIRTPLTPNTKTMQEERKMEDSATIMIPEGVATDEVTTISEGTIIRGDIMTNGSLDIRGHVEGNVGCSGKMIVTGVLCGNSNSTEFFADAAKIEGDIVSSGTVKIGTGSVVIGNVTSASAVIAGAIKGDIDIQGPVVVDTSAVVMGNIKSRSVQINNGAVIEGSCSQCYSDVDFDTLFESGKGNI